MSDTCKKIREQYTGLADGAQPDENIIRSIRTHAARCPACQDFFYSTSLSRLLREAFSEDNPEPGASFYAGLRLRIAEVEQLGSGTAFTELFARAGLRLAPVMAALLLFLSGSFAYVYTSAIDSGRQYSIEDVILFDHAQTSTDSILFNISFEEM